MTSRTVIINGKETTFRSKETSSGTIYFRSGKRVTSSYQVRLARGILAGLTPVQARGHGSRDFSKNFAPKALTLSELQERRKGARTPQGADVSLEKWGATFGQKREGKFSWYVDVRVTTESMKARGSDTSQGEEACQIATLLLTRVVNNRLVTTFTHNEVKLNFRGLMDSTLRYYKLKLCNDDLESDVVAFWRHSER